MIIKALRVALVLGAAGSPAAMAAPVYHHHRHHHTVVRAAPLYREANPSYTGYRAAGSPPQNMYDPTRPYGGQAAITAPMGTDAYEEQANQRRYFCDWAPERC